ncbi:MAG: hypothetical protein IJ894_08930 [Bacteroidales bacterium]|nr:hypothetical protein [Bacteroidales bacterium]
MLELDPKKLREIESDCFKEAKRNTPTKDMDQYAEILLKFVVQVFVSHFLPRLHRNRDIAANAKKMDFETVCATLLERHGKYADVEKDSRGFDYLYIKFHEGGVICLEPFRSGYYSTGFAGCESLIRRRYSAVLRRCGVCRRAYSDLETHRRAHHICG